MSSDWLIAFKTRSGDVIRCNKRLEWGEYIFYLQYVNE